VAQTPPPDAEQRGRPGRRSAEDRRQAVLQLLSGKATIDQLARRFGVLPSTIEGWRNEAVEAMTEALKRGSSKTERELQLERENALLRDSLASASLKVTLLERAAEIRPTLPARSRR
jgi:transposase-like protein